MSYARFGRNSDVYVYEVQGSAWECCRCSLSKEFSTLTTSRSQMIRHLQQHVEKGEKVPAEALEELKTEIEKLGDCVASP